MAPCDIEFQHAFVPHVKRSPKLGQPSWNFPGFSIEEIETLHSNAELDADQFELRLELLFFLTEPEYQHCDRQVLAWNVIDQ
jgi:hypothetical protein